jgi:putative oxidoreductase
MTTAVSTRFGWTAQGLLRVAAGLLFMQHGAQKLFGVLGGFGGQPGATAELFSLMGLAGSLEFFGGALLALGLLTQPVAFLLSGLMAAAFFMAHAPQGLWPILNGGELSALFSFVFLFFAASGPGRFSLDALIWTRGETAEPAGGAVPSGLQRAA